MLRLRTFGGLSLANGRVDGGTASRRRPLALLALLAIAGQRGLSREKVVAMLWPETDEEHGRNSLSQAMSALRRDMTADDLVAGGSEIRLNPDAITSDVDEFERCVASSELERAAELYQGPFLDGFFVKGADEFERWVDEHRRRLRQTYGVVLEKLARQADARDKRDDAITWWRRLATLEPASSSAAVGLMQALAATGDRAAALEYFRVYQAVRHHEFGIEADEVVAALAARLKRENGNRASPSPALPNDDLSSLDGSAAPATLPPANAADRDVASAGGDPDAAAVITAQAPPGRSRRTLRWAVVATAAGLAAIALIAFRGMDRRTQYNARQVVVTGFMNRTGDSTLDAFGFLAADYITDALQRSGLVEVTDPMTSLGTVTGVRDSAAASDEGKEIRLVAQATRAGLVVSGRYTREGDSIVIVARVSDAAQGRIIGTTEPVRGSAAALSDALDRVRQRVLGVLAVRLDDRLADVLPPGSTSPPTLPAYREYVEGVLDFQRQDFPAALPHLQRAYELDSTFVAPLIWQAIAFRCIDEDSARVAATHELARHRPRLSPLDGHVLEFFEAVGRSDLQARIAAARQAADLAPGSIWSYMLTEALFESGRFDDAAASLEQVDRRYGWMRNWDLFWNSFLEALHHAERPRELELQVAREAHHAFPTNQWVAYKSIRTLATFRRTDELHQAVAEMQALPDTAQMLGFFLNAVALELWSRGDTVYSRQLSDSAVAWFRRMSPADAERGALPRQFAEALYDNDRWDEALPRFQRFLAENPRDWSALTYSGLCFAHQGAREPAEEVISRLVAAKDSAQWRDRGHDVSNLLGAARIAAALGDRERAVRLLKGFKDRGELWEGRHALSIISREFHGLIGYPPYMSLTQHAR